MPIILLTYTMCRERGAMTLWSGRFVGVLLDSILFKYSNGFRNLVVLCFRCEICIIYNARVYLYDTKRNNAVFIVYELISYDIRIFFLQFTLDRYISTVILFNFFVIMFNGFFFLSAPHKRC